MASVATPIWFKQWLPTYQRCRAPIDLVGYFFQPTSFCCRISGGKKTNVNDNRRSIECHLVANRCQSVQQTGKLVWVDGVFTRRSALAPRGPTSLQLGFTLIFIWLWVCFWQRYETGFPSVDSTLLSRLDVTRQEVVNRLESELYFCFLNSSCVASRVVLCAVVVRRILLVIDRLVVLQVGRKVHLGNSQVLLQRTTRNLVTTIILL